jgi:oxygen-independent coproporphyrinogen-3 oxidase
VPWIRPHQRRIDPASLPPPAVKAALFAQALERLAAAGYRQVGMDHFALPGDELARAVDERRLERNFMGYTVRMGTDMVGVGLSAIGDVRGSFAQNTRKLNRYYRALERGRFPVESGRVLTDDDHVRRAVITRLMCNFHVDRRDVERRFGIDFGRYFASELEELRAPDGPVADGLLVIRPDGLELVGAGRLLVRNVCMVFDRYRRGERDERPVFSRTV